MSIARNITIRGHGYTHANVECKLVPLFGPRAGLPFTIKTSDNWEYGNKAKHTRIVGSQIAPVQNGVGKAEPDFKFDMSKKEFNDLVRHIGHGYLVIAFNISLTWQTPITKPQTDQIFDCLLEEDGHKSKVGDPTLVSVAGICGKCKINGVDPFSLFP